MDEITPPSTKMPSPPSGTPSRVGAAQDNFVLQIAPVDEKPLLFVDIDIGDE